MEHPRLEQAILASIMDSLSENGCTMQVYSDGKAVPIKPAVKIIYDGIVEGLDRWRPEGWNEEDEIVNLAKKLLYDYHPGSAENTIRRGSSYLAVSQLYLMLLGKFLL